MYDPYDEEETKIAQWMDDRLNEGVAWPDVVRQAGQKFSITNTDYLERLYDDWLCS